MDWLLKALIFTATVYVGYVSTHRPNLTRYWQITFYLALGFIAIVFLLQLVYHLFSDDSIIEYGSGGILGVLAGAFANDWAKGKWRFWRRQGSK